MTEQDKRPPEPDPVRSLPLSPFDIRQQRGQARRDKIVQEIMANRRGEYRVPTWVLTLCLALLIAIVVAVLIVF